MHHLTIINNFYFTHRGIKAKVDRFILTVHLAYICNSHDDTAGLSMWVNEASVSKPVVLTRNDAHPPQRETDLLIMLKGKNSEMQGNFMQATSCYRQALVAEKLRENVFLSSFFTHPLSSFIIRLLSFFWFNLDSAIAYYCLFFSVISFSFRSNFIYNLV